jgi:hypothetical protein
MICADLAVGWFTGLGMTDTYSPIAESADMVRSWNGRAKNLADEEFQLYRFRISSSKDGVPPALSRLFPGQLLNIVPSSQFGDYIGVGGSSRTLVRQPHAVTVRCLDLDWNDIPFTVAGKVVTLAEAATKPVRIFYRPELEVFVWEPWTVTTDEHQAEVSWDLVVEETGPPL